MDYNIPSDWQLDNGDFRTYCISWPDSLEWQAILFGVLSSFARGRTWNRNSGSIKQAQAIGKEIWARNMEPPPCNSSNANDDNEWLEILESSMAFINDIKCEDGALWVYKCCEWVKICDFGELTGNIVPETTPEPDPPPTDPACYKAGGFVQHFVPWMEWIYQYIDANSTDTPASILDAIKAQYPQTGWLWASAYAMIQQARWYPTAIEAMLASPLFAGELQCDLYGVLKQYGTDANNNNWILQQADRDLWSSYLYAYLDYEASAKAFVHHFQKALDFGYMQTVIASYGDQVYDCSGCETVPLSPQSEVTGSGWYLTEGFAGNGYVENTGGGINEGVCAFGPMPAPVNISGVAFRIVATSIVRQQLSTAANECGAVNVPNGPAQDFNFESYFVICDDTVWSELQPVAGFPYVHDGAAGWNNSIPTAQNVLKGLDCGINVINIVIREAPGISITDVRFVANVNNP